jgi:hypothetical protein
VDDHACETPRRPRSSVLGALPDPRQGGRPTACRCSDVDLRLSVVDPAKLGLIQLLEPGHPLEIPHFQRSYAWTAKEVQDYWDDLKAALEAQGGPAEYFMGLIVVDENRRIQDGQQRLATTLIFVQELYDLAKAIMKTASEYQEKLADEIAGVLAPLNVESRPVLVISDEDQRALLKRAGIATTLPESTRRLEAAREQLRRLLEEDVEGKKANAKLARLLSWARLLEVSAYVVELEVPPQVAHKIFETLNTRGVRLSNGDLVKSYLLARASNHDAAQHVWDLLINALTDAEGDYEGNLDDFLYHYYGSKYDKVVSKEVLFGAFSKRVAKEDPLDVLEELRMNAGLYAGLINPFTAPALRKHTEDARYAIQFINGMRFRQLRYLLLAVLRDYPLDEDKVSQRRARQSELISKIAAWSVRSLVTGRVGGQVAQSLYVAAAKAVRNGTATSVQQVKGLFLEKQLFVSTNMAFKEEFRTWRFDTRQARALLVELERAELSTDAAIALKGDLTLEHVLPRRPKSGTWKAFTGDDRTIYPHRVGNYLLLAQPFNSSLGNIEWPQKKAKIHAVRKSQTPLTVNSLRFEHWDQGTIDTRSKTLATKAATHWPS